MDSGTHSLQEFSTAGLRLGEVERLEDLYPRLYAEVRELIPELDGFLVTKYRKDEQRLTYPLCMLRGVRVEIPPRKVKASLTEHVIRARAPLLLPDGDEGFRAQHGINPPDPQLGANASEVVAPMFFQGRPLGTLNAFSYKAGFHYSQAHLDSLQVFANQAAAAIHTIDQLEEAAQLTRAASALARTHGKQAVLQAIVEEAHHLIDSQFTGLIVVEPDGALKKIRPVMPPEFFDRFDEPRQQDGVTRRVIETRAPRIIQDTSGDSLVKQSVLKAGIQSMLAFPLLHEDRALGVLYAHTFTPRYFSRHDVELWTTFATLAAAALDEADREEKEKDAYRRLANELGGLNEKMDLEQAMERVAAAAKAIFEADTCRLACVDPATERILAWTWAPGDRRRYRDESDPRPEGITRHVIRTRQPVFRTADQTGESPQPHPGMVSLGLQSVASLPLVYNGRMVGVLHCNYVDRQNPFDENLRALMEAYTARAAAALNRARRDQLHEGWRELDRSVFVSQDLDSIIRGFTEQARRSFQADFAVFFPYAPSLTREAAEHQEERCIVDGELRRPWQTPRGGAGGGVHQEVEHNEAGFLIVNDLPAQGGRYGSRLAQREGVEAFIAIRLMVSNPELLPAPQLAGILFLNFRQPTAFEPGDVIDLKGAGALVAAAILRLNLQSALQKASQQRITQLRMVNDITRSIRLERDGLDLDLVAERAATALGIDACSILLYDHEKGAFSIRGDHGLLHPIKHEHPRQAFKELYMEQPGPTIIADTRADPVMGDSKFVRREGILSTIVAPLRIKGESQGLFFANYRRAKALSDDEVKAITLIADFAALALHINTLGTALADTRKRIDKHMFLVWVSMIEDTWRHSIIQKSSAIRNHAGSLKQIAGNKKLQVQQWDRVHASIQAIDRLADEINSAPPRVPSSWEMQAEPVPLAALLQEVAERESKPLSGTTGHLVTVEARTEGLEDAQVLGHRRWLIYCLEILIQNARAALPQGGQVRITGTRNGTHAEIRIQDNGVGVPEEIRPTLFKDKISEKKDKKGLGIGSLLAATIVEDHDGSIELERPGPGDTTVLIRLPVGRREPGA